MAFEQFHGLIIKFKFGAPRRTTLLLPYCRFRSAAWRRNREAWRTNVMHRGMLLVVLISQSHFPQAPFRLDHFFGGFFHDLFFSCSC